MKVKDMLEWLVFWVIVLVIAGGMGYALAHIESWGW